MAPEALNNVSDWVLKHMRPLTIPRTRAHARAPHPLEVRNRPFPAAGIHNSHGGLDVREKRLSPCRRFHLNSGRVTRTSADGDSLFSANIITRHANYNPGRWEWANCVLRLDAGARRDGASTRVRFKGPVRLAPNRTCSEPPGHGLENAAYSVGEPVGECWKRWSGQVFGGLKSCCRGLPGLSGFSEISSRT